MQLAWHISAWCSSNILQPFYTVFLKWLNIITRQCRTTTVINTWWLSK
jgi:hypothetical protein